MAKVHPVPQVRSCRMGNYGLLPVVVGASCPMYHGRLYKDTHVCPLGNTKRVPPAVSSHSIQVSNNTFYYFFTCNHLWNAVRWLSGPAGRHLSYSQRKGPVPNHCQSIRHRHGVGRCTGRGYIQHPSEIIIALQRPPEGTHASRSRTPQNLWNAALGPPYENVG